MIKKPFLHTYFAQFSIILLLFAVCRFLSLYVFYNGFLLNFARINTVFFSSSQVPDLFSVNPYQSFSILLSSLIYPFFIGALLLLYLPLFIKGKVYKSFLFANTDKLIVFICAFLLAWELTTYDYNYYLNNAFYTDRIMLIALALLLLRSPMFLPLFIAWAYVYRSQFNYPVDGFTLFDKQVLFDVLLMFLAYVYTRVFFPAIKISFLFLVICIVASNYFMCAVAKIMISPHGYEWLLKNEPSDLFCNVHMRGWLSKSSQNTIDALYSFLADYGKFFQAVIFLLECSALFLLRSRKTAIILLCCLCGLHLGIFIFGSMLFWKWMCIDLMLIFILWRNKNVEEKVYSKKLFLSSLVIILSSVLWLRPVQIAWYDTPANQYFTYEVVDAEGKIFEFDKNQMNPYHQWFQYDQFLYLVNENCLPISGFGYTMNYKIAQAIKESIPEMYQKLEMKFGKNYYNETKKEKYEDFIKIYFSNRNQALDKTFIPYLLSAPHHLHSSTYANCYTGKLPVHMFKVIFNKVISKNGKAYTISKKTVDEIVIPS